MKKFILLFLVLLISKVLAITPCTEAGKDYTKFFELSIGQMIKISNSTQIGKEKLASMESLIAPCVDIERITTRVLGKTKWQSMSADQQKNFIIEYKKFFVIEFGEIILSTLKDVAGYTFRENRGLETYTVTLSYKAGSTKNNLSVEIKIEELKGLLQILDGKFSEISFVKSQRDLFDRLYDENPECVLNFNAETYRRNQCRKEVEVSIKNKK